MSKQFTTILTALGLPEDKITALSALKDDQLTDWKPDEFVTEIRNAQKTGLLNDADFLNSIPEDKVPDATKKKIESGQYARFQNELIEVATKQLGLEDKELTVEDRKSIKGLAKKMAETYLTKKGNVDGLQQMQRDLTDMTAKLEAKDTEWQTTLDNKLKENNGTANTKLLKVLTRSELADLDNIKLNVPAAYVTDPLLAKLSAKYALVLDDNDDIQLMQKANPALKATDTANKPLVFKQELRKLVLEEKVGVEVKADEGDGKSKKKTVTVGGGEGGEEGQTTLAIPSYIQKNIDANIKAEQAKK
jgi:hypothetical protein